MKLATFIRPGFRKTKPGIVLEDLILDLTPFLKWAKTRRGLKTNDLVFSTPPPDSTLTLLRQGRDYVKALGELTAQLKEDPKQLQGAKENNVAIRLSDVRLKAPIERPPAYRDFMAFEEHIKTTRARQGLEVDPVWYEIPVFYFGNPYTIIGPDADVSYPPTSEFWDYELELACVVGKDGRNIKADESADVYIAGLTILNDWSARDIQYHEMRVGLGPSKGKDFSTSLGPWITTLDELDDRRTNDGRWDLTMTARVNGEVYSQGNFKTIYWSFRQILARASRDSYVGCGDVLGSGTVGAGCIMELGPENMNGWLKPGDIVELEIERLGVLRNRVVAARKSH